jgi:hypothetical protein
MAGRRRTGRSGDHPPYRPSDSLLRPIPAYRSGGGGHRPGGSAAAVARQHAVIADSRPTHASSLHFWPSYGSYCVPSGNRKAPFPANSWYKTRPSYVSSHTRFRRANSERTQRAESRLGEPTKQNAGERRARLGRSCRQAKQCPREEGRKQRNDIKQSRCFEWIDGGR